MPRWQSFLESLGDALFRVRGHFTRFSDRGGVVGASTGAAKKASATWRQFTDPRQLRQILKSNQIGASVVSLVIIVGSASVLVWRLSPPAPMYAPGQMYFYDLGTGQVFAAPESDVPLIAAPSGAMLAADTPGGVGVAVFACGDCRVASQRKVGYLATRVSMAVAARLMPTVEFDDPSIEQVWIIAAPSEAAAATPTATAPGGNLQWQPADSPEGKAIRARVEKLCGDKPPTPCDSP